MTQDLLVQVIEMIFYLSIAAWTLRGIDQRANIALTFIGFSALALGFIRLLTILFR